MTRLASEEKIGQNSTQGFIPISDTREMSIMIHLLEIIIKVGKYSPFIFLSLASLNLLMAVNDFLSNSIIFGILNTIFAIGGIIFLVQMNQMKKNQGREYSPTFKINDLQTSEREVLK